MRKTVITLAILILLTLSCNLPTNLSLNTPTTPESLSLTVTAQVIQLTALANESPQLTNTPIITSVDTTIASPTLTPTAQIEFTPTPTLTATPSIPMANVSLDTNCRKGPGQAYNILGALLIGEEAEVVGKNTISNYWIIKNPVQPTATCWLWGKYATISGDQNSLPEINPPPTPTPTKLSPPNPVSNLQGSGSCDNPGGSTPGHLHTISGTISWKDNADNEQGFNIYADYLAGDPPVLQSSLGANSTSFSFSVLTIDNPFALFVESYNTAGSSKRVSISVPYNCHP
ncbi:MAG: hypothetical protein HN922_02780 [Anaerolineae bacterium]|jgi:hypothetical protein|nr:hypothetical protein [Anaerolineae bacterium]